jgi:hypothetical protein
MDTVSLATISIAPSPFTDHYAYGEIAGAGSLGGVITDTHYEDGSAQSVSEVISGGKKSSRYSHLEHTWLFKVQPGDLITLLLNSWHSNSSDGDELSVAWSADGGSNFQEITTLASTHDAGTRDFMLPADIQGEVQIRLRDTDRTPGHVAVDTVYVDEMTVRSEVSQGSVLPLTPSNLSVSGSSDSALALSWTDSASSEYGYVLARSANGGPWDDQYRTLAENTDNFTDTGLSPGTTYIYRAAAYNGAGSSNWSNQDSATTADKPAGKFSLTVNGYKLRGVHHASLAWSGTSAAQVDVYRDQQLVATVADTGSYTDNIGRKGNGSYSYEVCDSGTGTCSDAVTLTF